MALDVEIGKMTLSTAEKVYASDPAAKNFFDSIDATDYKGFINHVENSISTCIEQLERNPESHCKKCEDQITIAIRDMLNVMGFNAEHDVQVGGHVDLHVKKGSWSYHAEAKIFKGNAYAFEGWQQLTTRYAIGTRYNNFGGILLYLRNHSNTLEIMRNWKTHLETLSINDFVIDHCPSKPLVLLSSHTLERTGLPYHIRHIPISLYFKPQDKSGKTSQKYK